MDFNAGGGIVGVLIVFITIFGVFILPIGSFSYVMYYLLKTRNKERMELIKQGIIPSSQTKAAPNKFTALRNGCLFIALAIGIFVGLIVDYFLDYSDMGSFLIMLSSSIMFLGIGYVVFYLLVRNKNADEE